MARPLREINAREAWEMYELRQRGETITAIAAAYGLPQRTVSMMIGGAELGHLGARPAELHPRAVAPKGPGRGNRKLTTQQALQIRSRLEAGHRRSAIAAEYGVAVTTISNIASGASWARLGPPIEAPRRPGNAKLTEDEVREIRGLLMSGSSAYSLADQFGVSRTALLNIARGTSWRSVT